MEPAIRIQGLGKRYQVDCLQKGGRFGYRTLRDDLVRWASLPLRIGRKTSAGRSREDFWALRDVNFEVQPGEVVGIIGRNGAGKSTLLKILSRITKPTTGEVQLRGRVGCLLEVGTGFHPELTGRENIYLNGAILGMSRREIARKFDQIVDFAEIDKFLDTPVKRYSSGMYVRLAFAVAAHLEPEILIVDEVLAVGDIGFQRKCMRRMQEIGSTGCTVLFVSHNMPAIEGLCTRGLLLDRGTAICAGAVKNVINEYYRALANLNGEFQINVWDHHNEERNTKVFHSVVLLDETENPTTQIPLNSAFRIRIGFLAEESIDYPSLAIGIDNNLGQRVLTVESPLSTVAIERIHGTCSVDCTIPQLPLAPGEYCLKLSVCAKGMEIDCVDRALHFSVTNRDAFGDGRGFYRGLCVAPSQWSVVEDSSQVTLN